MDALKTQAHSVLEAHLGHNPQLLAAAKAQMEEQAAASPEAFKSRMDNSPEGKIKQCQSEAATRQYQMLTKALDDPIKKLLADKAATSKTSFPAVDLAAGSAYFTSQFALRYRKPFCSASFEWTPTDTIDTIEKLTRPCLTYLAGQNSSLGIDRNGDGILPKDRVVLRGLKTVTYNGKSGVVLHKDPKITGRYAVQLDQQPKPISFKAENFMRQQDKLSSTVEGRHQRLLSTQDYFYKGLFERSVAFDILNREAWPNNQLLEQQRGRCALVTCTNLLTEIGHREPTAWKIVMEIASMLLFPGGFLQQGDADGWGQFGNLPAMQDHAKSLGLTLQTNMKLDAWAVLLWRKDS